MSFQKKSTNLILISLVILGCVYTQRISIPLEINQKDQLVFSVKYGTKQCEINLLPTIGVCHSILRQDTQKAQDCGAKFVGYETYYDEIKYVTPLQLGNTQATVQFAVPTEQPIYFRENELCLGPQNDVNDRNILHNLFQTGQITEKKVFFSLNHKQRQNDPIGVIDFGAPNQSLIKKDATFAELKGKATATSFYVQASVKFFGKELDATHVNFQFESPFHQFPFKSFFEILSIFDKQKIEYKYEENQDYEVFLHSNKNLPPLNFSFIQNDNTYFHLTLQPSQYITQLDENLYQLMIEPVLLTSWISLSYNILENYYVGLNLLNESFLIAEKAQQQAHNL